ncbi:MAG TPA: Spy/CpxP family protein refolding chaperone [Vicinamibacteria bacterium]|jgi:Spy/CpxP family protein refolding chaperone
MRQEISRIAPVAVALLLGVAAVWAQAPEGQGPQGAGPAGQGPEGRGPHGPHDRMSRALDLNEAQQEKIREIREEQRPQREALHEKMSANREALHQLLESGTADANAVGELVLEGRKLHEEGKALFEAEQKKVRSILNPDQQKKFDAMQERMKEHRRGPEGFGMPRERGPRPVPGSSGRPEGSGVPDGPGSFGPSGIPGQPRSSPLGMQL